MNVNAKTCIRTLIEYSAPIERLLDYQNRNSCEGMPIDIFQAYVRDLITNVNLQQSESPHLGRIKNEIVESYSLNALQRHDYVIVDEGYRTIALNGFIDNLFRHIVDKMLLKPIPERKFKQHDKSLSEILKESKQYNAKSTSEREVEIEYINDFLRTVKSDFASNLLAIETHSENLSRIIESNENEISKREIMGKIVKLCDKYIEPFFRFLQTFNGPTSFIYKLSLLQQFFDQEGFETEANDINRFVIHFGKYIDEIKVIFDRVNSYRRKSRQDLLVFNTFEKAFNDLNDSVQSVLDGKKVRNNLESSDFQKQYTLLNGLRDTKKRVAFGFNPAHIVSNFEAIEKTLLLEMNTKDTMENREVNENMLREMEKAQREKGKITKKQREDKNLVNAILRRYQHYLRKPSDEDLMCRIYKVLRKHLPDDVFSGYVVLMAYFHMRSNHCKNVRVGFNQRHSFIDHKSNIKYVYRPVYAM